MADGTDMAAVIWLDHDRIRLYGFMGFLSKMLEWTGLIPQRLLQLLEHMQCQKVKDKGANDEVKCKK